MPLARIVTPELLDQLPDDHPDAQRNRREIHWINCLMGNYRWFQRVLPKVINNGEPILEIGAGSGQLANHLKSTIPSFQPSNYHALDLAPPPAGWPPHTWHQSDLLAFDGYHNFPCVVGNLILHQFTDQQIQALAPAVSHCRVLLFNEPLRSRRNAIAYRIAARFTLSHVSRHDGEVSIRAGFRQGELSSLLNLNNPQWTLHESISATGACRLIALRK